MLKMIQKKQYEINLVISLKSHLGLFKSFESSGCCYQMRLPGRWQ